MVELVSEWISVVYSFDRARLFFIFFFFSSRRRHTRSDRDWSSDVCSSDLKASGLRDARAYDSGVAVRTLTYSAASGHARREDGSSDRSGMHLPPAEAKLSVPRTLGQDDAPFVDLWCRRSARASRFRQCAWRARAARPNP